MGESKRGARTAGALFLWIIFLALAGGAPAQETPVVDVVDVELDGPCVRVEMTTSVPGGNTAVGLYYGKDVNPIDDYRTRIYETTDNNSLERNDRTCDLGPNTKYYILPYATDATQTLQGFYTCQQVCTNCDFGDGPTLASCDAVGQPLNVTTGDFTGASLPVDPAHSFDPVPEPTITGGVYPVAVDGSNRCTNLESQLQAAAAANSDLWHRVEIPPGAVCEVAELNLPQRTGPGFGNGGIVITTAGDSRLFPPQGVRPDPTYAAVFATLQPSVEESVAYNWIGQNTGRHWLDVPAGADGYRFQNVRLAPPEHSDMPVRQFEILDVTPSGNGVVMLLDRTHNFEHNDLVTLAMNPECIGLQGVRRLFLPSGSQIEIRDQQISGECTGGTVTQAISIPIASCTATTPVRCDTPIPHGLPKYEILPITSIGGSSNDTLTVATLHKMAPSGRYVRQLNVVRITGSPGGQWDGLRVVSSAGTTTIRLQGTFPSACSSNCGFFQRVDVLQVAETGSSGIDGSRHFDVIDDNTFELLDTSAAQPTTGGYFAFDPDVVFNFLPLALGNAERIVLDRTIVDCGGFPYRTFRCIAATTNRIAVVNSFLRDGNFWAPIDPLANYWNTMWQGIQFLYIAFGFQFQQGNDIQVLNNTFWNFRGIVWFADSTPSPSESDISFVRNLMYTTQALSAGQAGSDGRYYAHRHCWEQKAVNRTRIEGNWFSGNPVDHHPSGHCLVGSPRANPGVPERTIRDLSIRNNVAERTGAFLQLAGDNGSENNIPATLRVEISNNLVRDVDYVAQRTSPSGTSGPSYAGGFGGYFVSSVNALANLTVKQNTWMPARGASTHILRLARFSHSLVEFERNILSTPDDHGIGSLQTDLFPSCSGLRGPALFDCFVKRDGQRDPLSKFDDNVLIGCLRNPNPTSDEVYYEKLASTAGADTVHRNRLIEDWAGIERSVPNIYAGRVQNDDSCNDRVEQVLADGLYDPEPAYAGHGADIGQLLDAMGQMRDVAVSRPSSNTLRFAYQAPDSKACWVDVTEEAGFTAPTSIKRISDGGGAVQRTVDVPNVGTGDHWYRVQCEAHQARGKVQLGS